MHDGVLETVVGVQFFFERLPVPVSSQGRAEGSKSEALREGVPELRSCVKVEVAVLGFPSLIVLMVSVDVKQH